MYLFTIILWTDSAAEYIYIYALSHFMCVLPLAICVMSTKCIYQWILQNYGKCLLLSVSHYITISPSYNLVRWILCGYMATDDRLSLAA